jgi:hypothetical protein
MHSFNVKTHKRPLLGPVLGMSVTREHADHT